MRYITIVLLFCNCFFCYSQGKQDYNWLFGHESELEPGIESYCFDFNKSEKIDSMRGRHPISFVGLNASISDRDGNLLMYSNGCTVVDRNHEIMPNGRNLNNGDYFEMIGDSCFQGYLGKQDIMILPDPGYEDGYYILHKPVIYFPQQNIDYRELRYSYVDMNLNNGNGTVTDKNVVISGEDELFYRYLTALNHDNGKDWWLINPIYGSNGYLTYLLDEDGFSEKFIQNVGPIFDKFASASGISIFSPDGTKYALFNPYDNLLLYDFDRSTGLLSNLKQLKIKETEEVILSNIEFSPNSQFLYIDTRDSLWQVDTHEENLADGLELIDVWDGTFDPFATSFSVMALAPNCKIYMASGSSTNTYHVINEPNEKGAACDFVQRGIQLPFTSSLGNMPNFPRFRVDEADKCDPTITSIFGDDIYYLRDISVYPNPVRDVLTVEIPEGRKGQIVVFDMQGQLVSDNKCRYLDCRGLIQVDMSGLAVGTYSVEFIPDYNKEKLVYTSLVVKVE